MADLTMTPSTTRQTIRTTMFRRSTTVVAPMGEGGDGDNAGDPGSDDSPPSGDGDDPDWFDDGTNDSPGGDGFRRRWGVRC